MNKKSISEIINPFLLKGPALVADKLDNLTTNLESATPGDIVIYNLAPRGLAKFKERYQGSNAGAVIVNADPGIDDDKLIVVKENCLPELKELLVEVMYPMSDSSLELIGITGTNGKTTVSYLAAQISNGLGHPAISIGTLGVYTGRKFLDTTKGMTTPDLIDLRRILYRYKDYSAAFLEVSSHSLAQQRLGKTTFKLSACTSFSQDHLDYHKTMEDYLGAKLKIVDMTENAMMIVPNSMESIEKYSEFKNFKRAKPLETEGFGYLNPVLFQGFNHKNLEVALELNELLWGSTESIDFKTLVLPSGRLEKMWNQRELEVYVDYAHTPDALEKVLRNVRTVFKNKKIITVFGCGGNRDVSKRPIMGKVAEDYSDRVIVTSDNPRDEDPLDIINDIYSGTSGVNITKEPDRKAAIELALSECSHNDIVLVCGKGHESGQTIKGKMFEFSDQAVIRKILGEV